MSLQTRLADFITAVGADVKALFQTSPWKQRVRVVAVSNITLSGTQTIDGVSVVAGNRVLAAAQTTSSQNGVYIAASGAWTRDVDFDTTAEAAGAIITVTDGGLGATLWYFPCRTSDTLGTTSVIPKQIPTAGFGTAVNTVAQGNDSRIIGAAQKSANLSDLTSPTAALANLGAASTSQVSPVLATFTMQGVAVVRTGTLRYPILDFTYDIINVRIIVGTAPTGNSLKVDVKKNGGSIFNSQPAVLASTNAISSNNFSTLAVTDGDYFTVDLTQIGSTVAGADVTVVIELFRH